VATTPPSRVAHDHDLVDAQLLQDRARVPRHVVQVVGMIGLDDRAVADLIRPRSRGSLACAGRRSVRRSRSRRSCARAAERPYGRSMAPSAGRPYRPCAHPVHYSVSGRYDEG
jgi:hypothetical protein